MIPSSFNSHTTIHLIWTFLSQYQALRICLNTNLMLCRQNILLYFSSSVTFFLANCREHFYSFQTSKKLKKKMYMFSSSSGRRLLLPLRSYYSKNTLQSATTTTALKLCVKRNGAPSTKVSIQGYTDLDDFAKKVKAKSSIPTVKSHFSPHLMTKRLLFALDFKSKTCSKQT